jgi:transposase-like protein
MSRRQQCPMCGSEDTRVEEDVSDEVTVFACNECEATWAERTEA